MGSYNILGTKKSQERLEQALRNREEQKLSPTVRAYLSLTRDAKFVESFESQIRHPDGTVGCSYWAGPKRIRTNSSSTTYDPYRAFLFLICRPDWQTETVVKNCETAECFNARHFSVLSYKMLNMARFQASLSPDEENPGCLVWGNSSKFTILTVTGRRSIDPQRFIVGQCFDSQEELSAAYFVCENDSCLNREHLARRPIFVERVEANWETFFESLVAQLELNLTIELGEDCLFLDSRQMQKVREMAVTRVGSAEHPFKFSSEDFDYASLWFVCAAVMHTVFGFFAFPSSFRALGQVSLKTRQSFECSRSKECVNPAHRASYLLDKFKDESRPLAGLSTNENRLQTSLNLSQEQLMRLSTVSKPRD